MPKPKAYIPIAVTFGMFSFLLAAAFECSAPDFWALRSTKCFDQVGTDPQSSIQRADRFPDRLLDCVWTVRYNHRDLLIGYPASRHNVPADAERGEGKINHCSLHADLVSTA